jgi:hypothetical protein
MKRIAIFGVCLLSGVLSASAGPITVSIMDTDDNTSLGTLKITRTSVDGWDELDLNIASLSGHALGSSINAISGAWTALGSGSPGIGLDSGTGLTWVPYTTNDDPTVGESWINFDDIAPPTGSGFARTASGAYWSSFTSNSGAWYAMPPGASPSGDNLWATPGKTNAGIDDTLLAVMYVTPGANISYSGEFSFTYGGGQIPDVRFSTVPEPGSIAILVAGAVSLLAHAWRRRGRTT